MPLAYLANTPPWALRQQALSSLVVNKAHFVACRIANIGTIKRLSIYRAWTGGPFVAATICPSSRVSCINFLRTFAAKPWHDPVTWFWCLFVVWWRNPRPSSIPKQIAKSITRIVTLYRRAKMRKHGILKSARHCKVVGTQHDVI